MQVTNLLYVYKPVSVHSRCPREDVINHFTEAMKKTKSGCIFSYTDPTGTFEPDMSTRGVHVCEGKGVNCQATRSTACDYCFLDANGHQIPFATNSLAVHYLSEHWDDIKNNSGHLERLNKYLEFVGLFPYNESFESV